MKILSNKKILLGGLTLALVFAIIVVSSFWPFILDPERIGTKEFVTEQLIIVAITITSFVATMWIAQASNAQDPRSEIAKAKVEFAESMKRIPIHTHLYQWIKKVLQPNDREDIAEKGMARLGVDFRVWGLSDNEIRSLNLPQKYGDVFYKALTKEQIKGVFALKKKVKKIRFVSPNYYTSYQSMVQDKNLSEIASSETAKKITTVAFHLVLKITMTFIFSAILASLIRDIAQEGGSTAQAWMRFLSRMFAFFTSAFLGYMLGCKINDMDAFYIRKRVEVHTLYLEDTSFKPKDEGKEEFKERCIREERALIERPAHLIEHKREG